MVKEKKNSPTNAGDACLIPGSGRSLGEEMATHFSISFPEHSMDRGTWQAELRRVAKRPIRLSILTKVT